MGALHATTRAETRAHTIEVGVDRTGWHPIEVRLTTKKDRITERRG